MKKMRLFFIFLTLFVVNIKGNAEIQSVRLKWNPMPCNAICNQNLRNQLESIPGVVNVSYNPGFGEAVLDWKPKARFNFAPINNAMRMVGPSLLALNLKVTGTISHEGSSIYIESIGDGTRFKLLGALIRDYTRYIMDASEFTHPLSEEQYRKLIDAEQHHHLVTIEGALFEPESFLLRIVIENMNIAKKE
jgi:hypothetical protein